MSNLMDEYIRIFYGEPLTVISNCLRGFIRAPEGHELLIGDFANIEGRVLAWLAGEEWKLKAFRDFDAGVGPDIYKLSYSKSFGVPVSDITKDQRQIGKTQELALGFGGGQGAFQTMARNMGVQVSDSRAEEIKQLWRDSHPRIVSYWYDLERAVQDAVTHPGVKVPCRQTLFIVKGSFLFAKLPSGRMLTYPYPCLKAKETPWGEMKEQLHYWHVDGLTNKWVEVSSYGGKISENLTQATARDILAAALTRLNASGFDIVLHCHDEAVVEQPLGQRSLADFTNCMQESPRWAEGLPIAVEGFTSKRYRK